MNFRAIAYANMIMYDHCIQRNENSQVTFEYYNVWKANMEYARQKEKDEYNEKVNISWRNVSKEDPKKLWERIEYKEKTLSTCQDIDMKGTRDYFTDIFQP